MIRSVKAPGLALVALMVMGVEFASPASAQFESESSPATLTTSSNMMQKFAWTAGGTAFECTTMTLDSSTQASAKTTTVEIKPTYSNCENFIGLSTAYNMNGCGYLLHSAAGSTTATTDVKCPAGKKIEISIGGGLCLYTIEESAANTGLGTLAFNNKGTGSTREVEVESNVAGITSTRVNNGFGCPAADGTGTRFGSWTMTGESLGGATHVALLMD